MPLLDDEAYARQRDADDPLAALRERFYVPDGMIYLDGNSLGLLSRDGEASVMRTLEQWKRLGVGGWSQADPPWYYQGEDLGRLMAPLVGAASEEVVATGATTVNLHALVATFYRPKRKRNRIIATALDFPSDVYALAGQLELHRRDPAVDLVLIPSRDGRMIEEADIIAAFDDTVALALLPSVLYRSGQMLDMERLTSTAHEHGIIVGFDCAHSIGAVPHSFDDWDVDFAFWCGYKYLNGGPGGVAGLYVNRRHFDCVPLLRGWWGSDKDRQFDMAHAFVPATGAGRWQISTTNVLGSAALGGALQIFAEVGIDAVRDKSLALTDYLIALLDEMADPSYSYIAGTPRDHARRGGHVAVEHVEGARIAKALKARGVIPDFRPPNVIRLAPIALYTSFHEVWQAAQHLKAIIDNAEHLRFPLERDLIA